MSCAPVPSCLVCSSHNGQCATCGTVVKAAIPEKLLKASRGEFDYLFENKPLKHKTHAVHELPPAPLNPSKKQLPFDGPRYRPLNKPPNSPRTMRRPVVPVSSLTTMSCICWPKLLDRDERRTGFEVERPTLLPE